MRRLFVHVDDGGENIPLANLLLHKCDSLGKVGLHLFLAFSIEELRACRDDGVYKHRAVLAVLHPAALMRASISFLYF